jgi:hypothetical protein
VSISHRPLPALDSPPCPVASLFFHLFIHSLLFSPASTLLTKARFFALPSCPCPIVWCTYQHKPRGFILRQPWATAFNCPPPASAIGFCHCLDLLTLPSRRRQSVPVHSGHLQATQSSPCLTFSTRCHCAFPRPSPPLLASPLRARLTPLPACFFTPCNTAASFASPATILQPVAPSSSAIHIFVVRSNESRTQ